MSSDTKTTSTHHQPQTSNIVPITDSLDKSSSNDDDDWQRIVELISMQQEHSEWTCFVQKCLSSIKKSYDESINLDESSQGFFMSLVTYLSIKLLEGLETFTIDKVNNLEEVCDVIIKFYLNYLSKWQHDERKESNLFISNLQIIEILDSLLTGRTLASANLIDMHQLLAMLKTSKCVQTNKLKDALDDDAIAYNKLENNNKLLQNLMSSYLSQDFDHKSTMASKVDVNVNQVVSKTSRELFIGFMLHYFHLHNGLEVLINECEKNLIHLHSYRINQEETSEKVKEEASNAKLNCTNLTKEVTFLLKFLQMPIFDGVKLDKWDVFDKLDQLIISAQIAALATSSSDYLLRMRYSKISSKQDGVMNQTVNELVNYEDMSHISNEIIHLAKLSIDLLNKYFKLIEVLTSKMDKCYLMNLNAKMAYVFASYLNKVIDESLTELEEEVIEEQLEAEIKLFSNINVFISKLVAMLAFIFDSSINEAQATSNASEVFLFKSIQSNKTYSSVQYFNFLNNHQATSQVGQKILPHRVIDLFSLLFNLFKFNYAKGNAFFTSVKASKNQNLNAKIKEEDDAMLKEEQQTLSNDNSIRNIDDPNTSEDDETTTTVDGNPTPKLRQSNSNEDSEDFLLIGSWFEDQLNSSQSKQITQQMSVNQAASKSNPDGTLNDPLETTQVIDQTFELELSSSISNLNEAYGFIDVMMDIMNLIEHMVHQHGDKILSSFEKSLNSSTNENDDHVRTLCRIFQKLESPTPDHLPERFALKFYAYLRFLIAKNLLTTSKQDFILEQVQLSHLMSDATLESSKQEHHLRPNKNSLALMCQIFVSRISSNYVDIKLTKAQILNIWLNFLQTIKLNAAAVTSDINDVDVRQEQVALLLFLFHNLASKEKEEILVRLVETLIEICEIKVKSLAKQLLATRLLVILDYLLHRFVEPSTLLLNILKDNLFSFNASNNNSKQQATSIYLIEQLHLDISKSANNPDVKPTPFFYSFNQTDLNLILNKTEIPMISQTALEIVQQKTDYNRLYSCLVNLLRDVSNQCDTRVEYVSTLIYTFAQVYSLLDPLELPVSKDFHKRIDQVKLGDNLNEIISLDTIELLQCLRVAYKKNEATLFDANNLDLTLGGFSKFWSTKLNLTSMCQNIIYKCEEPIDMSPFKCVELLSYHLDLIKIILVNVRTSSELRNLDTFIETLIKISRLFIYLYKRNVVLKNEYGNVRTETLMLLLNASSSSTIDSSFVANESNLFPNLNQINFNSESNALIDLVTKSSLLTEFSSYLNTLNTKQNERINLIGKQETRLMQTNENACLYLNVLNQLMNESDNEKTINVAPVLSELVSLLANQALQLINVDVNDETFKKLEYFFISLNGDMASLPFISAHVMCFFRSNRLYDILLKSDSKLEKQQIESLYLTKVSSFTFEIIFKLCVNQYLGKNAYSQCNDKLFVELLSYMEKQLDTTNGVEGFCAYFASKSNDKDYLDELNDDEIRKFYTDKFLVFILTSASKANNSRKYFIQMLSLLNKLFKLSFQIKDGKAVEENGSSNVSVTSILTQLNLISDLDVDFVQNWLSKIISITEMNSEESIRDSFILLEFSIFFVCQHLQSDDDKVVINDSATLSILNSLIHISSKLIYKTDEAEGFTQLLQLMDILASGGQGTGHLYLFQACCTWLEHISTNVDMSKLVRPNDVLKEELTSSLMQSVNFILSYICNTLNLVKPSKTINENLQLNQFDSTVPEDLSRMFKQKILVDFYQENLRTIEQYQKLNNMNEMKTNTLFQQQQQHQQQQQIEANQILTSVNGPKSSEFYENQDEEENDDIYNDHDEDDEFGDEDGENEDSRHLDNARDYDEDDYDEEENDDDDDDSNFQDFDEKSSYASASSTNASTKVSTISKQINSTSDQQQRPTVIATSSANANAISQNQSEFNEYYEGDEDDEDDEDDVEEERHTLNAEELDESQIIPHIAVETTQQQQQQSEQTISTLNHLFDVNGEDDDDEDDTESHQNAHAEINPDIGNRVISRREEDEDDDDEDEDDEDEYGDEFNDNFVIDYEQVEHHHSNGQSGNSLAIQQQPSIARNSIITGETREAIYQDLMSTITTAAAAISGRMQQQQQQQPQGSETQFSQTTSNADPATNSLPSNELATPAKPSTQRQAKASSSSALDPKNDINSKLCTYSITKKEFMNQHWYYCHTCKMIDRIGMCTICAKVCHKGHDVSYAKYGSFFCDCGAKEDGSCLAMKKRTNPVANKKKPSKTSKRKLMSRNKSTSSSTATNSNTQKQSLQGDFKNSTTNKLNIAELMRSKFLPQIKENNAKNIEKIRNQLLDYIASKDLLKIIRCFLDSILIPFAKDYYENSLLKTNSYLARNQLMCLKGQSAITNVKDADEDDSHGEEAANANELMISSKIEPQNLLIVTLGSQEGAFENVRMTYAGDHGTQIKQLVQSHSLRRTSMCCVASKQRKHLIVTHEKGKSSHFTILQLNALLKQDSNKRNKLTLTKLNTIPVPFTLISVVSNVYNEDYIALVGLKECYIMYLNENGQTKQEITQQQTANSASTTTQTANQNTNEQAQQNNQPKLSSNYLNSSGLIVLHPSLEGSNFIIKSIWLPGSQTELALVTSDFIKIYDLSVDKISPIFYFLLPMGKIKDVTFVYDTVLTESKESSGDDDDMSYRLVKYIVIISSCGYLYYEEMNDVTSAQNGIYYITNVIEFDPETFYKDNKLSNKSKPTATLANNNGANNQFGGGVSVYYSFKLKLLFWSYLQGKTFIGSFRPHELIFDKVSQLSLNKQQQQQQQSSQAITLQQPLCSWSEISTHPGLVMAMTLLSNNPVVLMFLPDKIFVQEIKMTNNQGGPSKVKIQDMVAIRHSSSSSLSSSSLVLTDSSSSLMQNQKQSDELQQDELDNMESSGLPPNNNEKTTMIILCDDGSLKIYVADSEKTEYWLQPHLQATNPILQLKSNQMWSSSSLFQLSSQHIQTQNANTKAKLQSNDQTMSLSKENLSSLKNSPPDQADSVKSTNFNKENSMTTKISKKNKKKANQKSFPIDYFENCITLSDVEYGGSDLLEVYNANQLKARLSLSGNKFIVSTKPNGFKLEITNVGTSSDAQRSLLMGCRIFVGTHSLERVPQYFEINNRRIQVKLTRPRWFDICLTREEAFIADNKLIITVGPSLDSTQRNITIIDACIAYGKSKESLNWTKTEAQSLQKRSTQLSVKKTAQTSGPKASLNSSKKTSALNVSSTLPTDAASQNDLAILSELKPFDRLLTQSLDLFENCLLISMSSHSFIQEVRLISMDILSLICPSMVVYKAKSLLFNALQLPSVSPLTSADDHSILIRMPSHMYNIYKDEAILSLIANTFKLSSTLNAKTKAEYNDLYDHMFDIETLEKVLLICRSLIQQQRANNLVKFLNEKFSMFSCVNNGGQKGFIVSLNKLFWRVVNRSPLSNNALNSIGEPLLTTKNLKSIVESLVEIFHAFLLVELTNVCFTQQSANVPAKEMLDSFSNSAILNLIFESFTKLLSSDILDVNFTARKCLLQLLKSPKKSSTSVSTINVIQQSKPININPPPKVAKPLTTTLGSDQPVTNAAQEQERPALNQQTLNIDEQVNFASLNQNINANEEDINDLVDENEDNEENSEVTTDAAAAIAAAIVGNASLAPYVFNEDDEMLQLAMALSLNEPQFQESDISMQSQPPLQINEANSSLSSNISASSMSAAPLPMPRTLFDASNNSLYLTELKQQVELSRQNSNETTKSTTSSKSKRKQQQPTDDTSDSSNKVTKTSLIQSQQQQQQQPQYLTNLNLKLFHLRKIFLAKFSLLIESNIFEANESSSSSYSTSSMAHKSSGLKCISFFQCILILMADLNPKEEEDKKLLDQIIQSILNLLNPLKNLANQVAKLDENNLTVLNNLTNSSSIYTRTTENEIKLICLRTISILLSKSKYQRSGDNCNFIIQTLLSHLCQFNMIDMCLNLMKFVYFDYWKKMSSSANSNGEQDDQTRASQLVNSNSSGLMRYSNEAKYHDELGPYFVRDPLNKDSFVIPPPILLGASSSSESSSNKQTQQQSSLLVGHFDLFDNYMQLLTEILIRLPYQMKKLCLSSNSANSTNLSNQTAMNSIADMNTLHQLNLNQLTSMFDFSMWMHYLCEYLCLPNCYYLKRLIKKLLQILCGSKDKYRKFKDQHLLTSCFKQLGVICPLPSSPSPLSMLSMGPTVSQATQSIFMVNLIAIQQINNQNKMSTNIKLTYPSLIRLLDHVKSILEVALARTSNWQRFCAQNPTTILYLIELALLMGVDSNGSGIDSSSINSAGSVATGSNSVIVPNILQLLLCCLGGTKAVLTSSQQQSKTQNDASKSASSSKTSVVNDDALCSLLVNSLYKNVSKEVLMRFIRTYLLEAMQPSLRWTLHSLLYSIFKNSTSSNQEQLYDILLQLWPEALVSYGAKASQYVDLIGYIVIKTSQSQSTQTYENQRLKEFLQRCIHIYQEQNLFLASHPNSMLYNCLSNLLADSFDGLYLDSDPCFICNNIEMPLTNMKLNSIKTDARFTTSQQIFKLTSCHSISKILIKISEIRKSKMVSVINVYYTSKSVQSIVDLKMNTKLWCKAKRIHVDQAQQEVKIEFQLPIIASNLIIEYADFYDRDSQTQTAESTMLQCPRCSASVPAHPGVCNTCGENVFQCHKCRSINYDERDPFLCNSCGFCKFAKFDFTLVGRPCSAIDPIESEDDRKQTLQQISSLLERADKIYYTLSQHAKPALEALFIKLNEQNILEKFTSQPSSSTVASSNNGSEFQQPNVIGIRLTPLTIANNTSSTSARGSTTAANNLPSTTATSTSASSSNNEYSNNKTVQSIIQKYTVECKTKFDELMKIILKLNLCRKELREYDKQFKSYAPFSNVNSTSSAFSSASATRKSSLAFVDLKENQLNRIQTLSNAASSYLANQKSIPKNNCYGCAMASVEHCITLFRVLLCANNLATTSNSTNQLANNSNNNLLLLNYVKQELCNQGILEELINFSLRRNNSILISTNTFTVNAQQAPTTSSQPPQQQQQQQQGAAPATTSQLNNHLAKQQRLYDRDIINLIYLLLKDNPDGTEMFNSMMLNKIEKFLSTFSVESNLNDSSNYKQVLAVNNQVGFSSFPVKYEMMLLSCLMTKQEDSCWEMRLRLVITILLRSLNAATSGDQKQTSHYKIMNNPILIEYLTLPCLRILNHICKTTTNMAVISQQATKPLIYNTTSSAKASLINQPKQYASIPSVQVGSSNLVTGIARYNSEQTPDTNYFNQSSGLVNNFPSLSELNPNEFLQNKLSYSYYEKWLATNSKCLSNDAEKFKQNAKHQVSNETQAYHLKIRTKYFIAWRKYILKKRKQMNKLPLADNSHLINLPQQIVQPTDAQSPKAEDANNTVINQIDNGLFKDAYDFNLKSKWLKLCLFCPSSRSVRQLTCQILQNIFNFYSNSSASSNQSLAPSPLSTTYPFHTANHSIEFNNSRKFQIAELLCKFIDECGSSGECFAEFFNLFKTIINDKDCKYRLVLRYGVLSKIEVLLHKEIRYLSELERSCETSALYDVKQIYASPTNLTLGCSIKYLTEILAIFLKESNIKNKFKGRLIATVLNSYLSLKRLVFYRTKLVEEAQEKLLNILEQLTTGTESETRKFMSICIDTVNNFDLDDLVTPCFIFERLCNIIYPEEIVDNKEFLIILEKDPNQEDYLQGRMLGNPYSSNDPGLCPLMRNIKNKICTDCELIALLEDDNGMELLVNNKIISLDLPVRDVYKKVWLSEVYSEHEPMRIVYRMTGLSGDATEDIIENLDTKGNDSTKNDEEIYRMADELSRNGALSVMLERLASITQQNFTFGKSLLSILLKLFDYALKLSVNRVLIIQPEMKAITTMLQTLNMMLKIEQAEPNKIGVNLAEKLLHIMECILSEASKQPAEIYNEFSSLCGDTEQLEFLLNNIKCTFVRSHPSLLQALMRLIPFLSFGDEKKMKSLISYFSNYFSSFDSFDKTPMTTQYNEDTLHLECFCVIVNGIEIGEMGMRLRDMMRDGGVIQKSIEYLLRNSPKVTTYLNSDFELWKDFISRSSLPYVLRILTGLCRSHQAIQDLIGESCIPILHKLEQFSSGNLVGVLAEDLLVALKQDASSKVAAAIEEVRNQTKIEKKKLAMAMRQKQLNQLGMKTNDKGQLIASDPSTLKNITDEVEEEKGHICCICREGYKYHPQKVLAIYTFTKKCDLDPVYEAKSRKTIGYTTVTHFNLVHIDCHTNAIRSARTCRDEWENAALQNANTKCNGILPIWGPDVTETLFSNALARHNNYLLEATAIRDSSYILSVHDLKLLLLRFSENLSFSEDSGGGGRESNINLIPYMIHAILYTMNTTKFVAKEEKNLNTFLEATEKVVSNSFEVDNVFYFMTMALVIMKPSTWLTNKLKFLKRILLTQHARLVNTPALDKQKLSTVVLQEFKKYKSSLLFIGLINLIFKHIHSKVDRTMESGEGETGWTERFANYIRQNDVVLMDSCKKVLKDFEEELIVCEDWTEMFDVLSFYEEEGNPLDIIQNYLQNFSK